MHRIDPYTAYVLLGKLRATSSPDSDRLRWWHTVEQAHRSVEAFVLLILWPLLIEDTSYRVPLTSRVNSNGSRRIAW
jgi:hypothetical protein